MILRTNQGGLVLLFIACLTCIAHTEVIDDDGSDMPQRFKRDYQDDPKDYLDKVIEHWIYKIPVLIDIAVAESEKDLRLTVAKRVTQGWSIVVGSWKDILSDYVANDRTLGNLGDMSVIYNYGFLFTYGIGFGFPLLLGLPDEKKSCGRHEFLNTLAQYDLQKGLAPLLYRGAALADIESLIIEFQLVVGTKLSCIDSGENLDSLIVTNAVSSLITAMFSRLQLEVADSPVRLFQARKLDLEKENQQKFDAPLLSQDLSKDQAVNNFLAVEKAAPVFSGI